MVSDVTIGSALNQQQRTDAASGKLADDFSQFLTLLTVQLQNQDPLSPMDTTEFTNQLVAFTGVEQQINTNQKLDSLVALGIGTAYSAAQSYVGQEVSYLSSEFEFTGEPAKVKYSLASPAELSKIHVYNEAGDIVYTEDASKSTGVQEFVWNGRLKNGGTAAPGTYQVRVDALDANEKAIESSTVVTGKVRGTESQNGQIFLLIGERAVALSNILNTNKVSVNGANDSLTAALSYVGLDVSYLNTQINYNGQIPADVIYTLDAKADEGRAKIMIFNDIGEKVYVGDVDEDKGQNLFRWNGTRTDGTPLPAGKYQFVIDAIDANDQRIPASSIASGRVSGIETKGGKIYLNLGSNSVDLGNVVKVDVPETTEDI